MRLSVDIIGHDCTNKGVTSGKERATLIFGESDDEIAKNPPQGNCVLVLHQAIRGGKSFRAEPLGETRWCMFGGHFIYTSDSRFPSDAPIKVFDRIEVQNDN